MEIRLTWHSIGCIFAGVFFGSALTSATFITLWSLDNKNRNTDASLIETAKCEEGFNVNVATSQGGGFGCTPSQRKK